MSLNDVCVYVPAWFGVSATVFVGLLASECANSWSVGAAAAGIMSIIPAHIMRSVGGGYDNESIAMTAMACTFYCWCRALRDDPNVVSMLTHVTRRCHCTPFCMLKGMLYLCMLSYCYGLVTIST